MVNEESSIELSNYNIIMKNMWFDKSMIHIALEPAFAATSFMFTAFFHSQLLLSTGKVVL